MTPKKETELVPSRLVRDPFALMREMTSDFDRFFGEPTRPFFRWPSLWKRAAPEIGWYPEIDVFEKDNRLVTKIDLPGMKKEDVKVELTDDALTIQGERQEQREGRGYSERTYGSFYRTVPLPEGINTEGAQAKFQDGVLEVSIPMPKREQQQKHKQLEIR